MIFALTVSLPFLPVPASHAATCDDDTVDAISTDGTILKTLDGHVYEINGAEAIDVAVWLPGDDLLICPTSNPRIYKIINTDENNEAVYAIRLR